MSYEGGLSLHDHITQVLRRESPVQRLEIDFQRSVCLQAAFTLHEFHTVYNKAHGNLKPENLFITRDGTLKLLDFGHSLPKNDTLYAGKFGKSIYNSPEAVES